MHVVSFVAHYFTCICCCDNDLKVSILASYFHMIFYISILVFCTIFLLFPFGNITTILSLMTPMEGFSEYFEYF